MKKTNYFKGNYAPKNINKYVGTLPVIFRSSYERKFCHFCDHNPSVVEWSSESIVVPYYHPFKKRMVRYFPDFYIKVKNNSGRIIEYLIEVKPAKETVKPTNNKRKKYSTKIYEQATFRVNVNKWLFAKKFAEQRGWTFKLVTERELGLVR